MKIKVFDMCWHIPHQWDMINALSNDCEFTYCLNVKRQWDKTQRPLPENLNFVTHYDAGTYDVAILHIDQQVIVSDHQKRLIYDQFNSVITDIPKIVINHGTPVFPEVIFMAPEEFDSSMSQEEIGEACIEIVQELIGDNTMVVNSYRAAGESEWGFGIPIIHGLNPAEWWDLPKEPRAFTALSSYGFDAYYNRKCMIEAHDELLNNYGHTLNYANLNVSTNHSPEAYKEFLGKSLLYIDTSYRTPMNRARTEAFLSGCCVVQVEGAHDLERWAKPGENIILVKNDPKEIARLIADFLENRYREAIAIGQRGKEMAIREFSPERYRVDWLSLFSRVMNS